MQDRHSPIKATFNYPTNSYPDGFNPSDYEQDFDIKNFTPEEVEILQIYWWILENVIHLGWGVDSVQLALPELLEADRSDSVKPANDNNDEGETHD